MALGKPGRGLMVIHTLINKAQEVIYPQLKKNNLPVNKQVNVHLVHQIHFSSRFFTSDLDDISKRYSCNLKYFLKI